MTPRRRFLAVFGAGLAAGCGGGTAGSAVATASAPSAASVTPLPAPPVGRGLPVTYHLFGPVQKQAALGADGEPLPAHWHFPGSALTPSTTLVPFDVAPRALSAVFRVCWTTESIAQRARLVHFDDGPANIVEMKALDGRGGGLYVANNQPIDVTEEFNALVGGAAKNLGLQLLGDGVSRFLLWSARLEITWELT